MLTYFQLQLYYMCVCNVYAIGMFQCFHCNEMTVGYYYGYCGSALWAESCIKTVDVDRIAFVFLLWYTYIYKFLPPLLVAMSAYAAMTLWQWRRVRAERQQIKWSWINKSWVQYNHRDSSGWLWQIISLDQCSFLLLFFLWRHTTKQRCCLRILLWVHKTRRWQWTTEKTK